MSVHHMHAWCLRRPEEGVMSDPLELESQSLLSPMWVMGTRALEEHWLHGVLLQLFPSHCSSPNSSDVPVFSTNSLIFNANITFINLGVYIIVTVSLAISVNKVRTVPFTTNRAGHFSPQDKLK